MDSEWISWGNCIIWWQRLLGNYLRDYKVIDKLNIPLMFIHFCLFFCATTSSKKKETISLCAFRNCLNLKMYIIWKQKRCFIKNKEFFAYHISPLMTHCDIWLKMKECVTYVSGVYCTPSPTYSLPLCKTKSSLSHPIPYRHQDRLCSKDQKTVPTHAQHNATERKRHSEKALHACTHPHTHTHTSHTSLKKHSYTNIYKTQRQRNTFVGKSVCSFAWWWCWPSCGAFGCG